MKKTTILFLIACLLHALPGSGQQPTPSDVQWENLNYLKPGTKISVYVISGGWIRGKFAGVESKELYLKLRNEQIRLKRENIRTVAQGGPAMTPALIGATIGFAAGAAFGNYMVSAFSEGYDTFGDHLSATALCGLLGAGTGLMIGSQIPVKSNEKILYEDD
jgi:hypothetical protein